MPRYSQEPWTPEEADVLRRYFTNLDRPVFALVNLPEVVKGALFARYSRSAKPLRRLFLDEFVGDLDISGDQSVDATVGLRRAEELYGRVFLDYGDDSVAQLGGVHLACEQASNILTKILEWGRVMAYMEQSTRYVAFEVRLGDGRYRYHRDPAILGSQLGARYVGEMDRMFDTYSQLFPAVAEWVARSHPKGRSDSDLAWRRAVKARALDAVRGLLPAASLSNVGVYGSGQAYEALLLRMRSHPLPEAGAYAEMMLEELRKVVPSFLTRVDRPERGCAWSAYLAGTREATASLAAELTAGLDAEPRPLVSLVDYDPAGEDKVITAILYPHTSLPEDQVARLVADMSGEERAAVMAAYVGERTNRRLRPGRALERTTYRYDVVSDYGAFRDLQRHRMLTIEWQSLGTDLGWVLPDDVAEAGLEAPFRESMERSAELREALAGPFPEQAGYAVALAYRIRYSMQMNAREVMHITELRSASQGHDSYREVAQEMHRLVGSQAGHRALAGAMRFVDHGQPALGRLQGEDRAERRRAGHTTPASTGPQMP
ncbi:MAG: FAD-dependent thymidylate synthase [Acidimicrobiales bacterium]